MLAGERFSDRPASVCPIIGGLLRVYNDNLDDERRGDLYRYAAEAVGTRGEFGLQLRRAKLAIAWARASREVRTRRRLKLGGSWEPAADSGPDQIAGYVLGSLGPQRRGRGGAPGGWSDAGHASMLGLLDLLIAIGAEQRVPEPLPQPTELEFELGFDFEALAVGEIAEQVAEPVEDRCGDSQLVV
jgi:hypothetical protein